MLYPTTSNPTDIDNYPQRLLRVVPCPWPACHCSAWHWRHVKLLGASKEDRARSHLPHQSCSKASLAFCCSSLLAFSINFTSLCSSSSTGSLTTSMARRLSRSVRHSMATSKDRFFAWRARSAASFTWKKQPGGWVQSPSGMGGRKEGEPADTLVKRALHCLS